MPSSPPRSTAGPSICTPNASPSALLAGTSEQLLKFVRALHNENTPVFLLDDGKELADSLRTLQANFRVKEISQLDVPFYFPNSGGSQNRRVALYRVD